MAYEFRIHRRVEFVDTDSAGIVHFSNFFRFMEETEHAFYRSLGFTLYSRGTKRTLGWPRVSAECRYKSPLRFDDVVEVHLLVQKKTERSLRFRFGFQRLHPEPAEEIAEGRLTVVFAVVDSSGKMSTLQIPTHIAEKIEVAPALCEESSD